jgi:uncharacterized protein (TIGR02646 family)
VIRIVRDTAPPAIAVYTDKKSKAANGSKATRAEVELEKAIAFFTDPGNYENDQKLTDKAFSFAVYKDPDLAEALEAVFRKKCAYCESRFAHVTPKDIEHYRPKSEIDTGAGVRAPGYYWLAGTWSNLLVSCIDCNRPRKHEVPGQAAKRRLGKSTQFPLVVEAGRVRSHLDLLDAEEAHRLLLDPCVDRPEDHLSYDDQGLVRPRVLAGNQPSSKAAASIEVYALQRKGLVEERLRILNDAKLKLVQLSHLVAMHNDLAGVNAAKAAANLVQIQALSANLRDMLAPTSPYLGMLRDLIRTTKAAGGFADLIQFGIDPEELIDP